MLEEVFGLIWNYTLEFQIIDDATRSTLLDFNPSVTFSLSDASVFSSPVKEFKLHFAALDLRLYTPLLNDTMFYFPLKRSMNSSKYVLGRTFLQEIFLTIDYIHGNLSMSQFDHIGSPGYVGLVSNATNNDTGQTIENMSGRERSEFGNCLLLLMQALALVLGLRL